ncbi:1-acyl-sn-glycerol-3-phosphate acyltransferase [Streptomyces fuscichromogenes]|uniref:Phospholipid/glycerol acyltransferase domain-containing protein n=1 Tax=Streptomyces fuscichromogenes TaxID=1324013 RepID=A0A917XCQ3_9ACTN|nr:hypothetical protein GCM10011578_035900 [Streptomyces fuscichromogenes]
MGAGALIALGVRAAARVDTDGIEEFGDLAKGPLTVIDHRSFLDPLVVVTRCRRHGVRPYTFARQDFFDRPVNRTVLRLLRAIPALRGRSALDGPRRAERLLDHGQVVAIDAEGRIVRDHERSDGVGELRGGAAWLACRAFGTVVLTVTGTDDAWPVGRTLPRWRPLNRPTVTVRARRRGHQCREDHRGRASGLRDRGGGGTAHQDRPGGGGGDRHALPALPEPAVARRGGVRADLQHRDRTAARPADVDRRAPGILLEVAHRIAVIARRERGLVTSLASLGEKTADLLARSAPSFDEFVVRGQAVGNLRADISGADVPNLPALFASSTAVLNVDAQARRRYLRLMLDALRPQRA